MSLGLKAIESGYRVLFTTAAHLIATLTKAHAEGRLDETLKVYMTPRLLLIDEIGYLPIDRIGANLFFQLISRRYERGPMILTSNQSFGAWGDVFGTGSSPPPSSTACCTTPSRSTSAATRIGSRRSSRPDWSAHTMTMGLNRVGKFELPQWGKLDCP